jgi:hypothetical protein
LAGVEFCFGKYIGSLIETVIMTHPNCSSLLSEYGNVSYASVDCEHYTTIVSSLPKSLALITLVNPIIME